MWSMRWLGELHRNTLTSAYNSLEKKQAKLLEQVRENEAILKFLGEKIAKAFQRAKEPKYFDINDSPFLQQVKKDREALPQEEQDEIMELIKQESGITSENCNQW